MKRTMAAFIELIGATLFGPFLYGVATLYSRSTDPSLLEMLQIASYVVGVWMAVYATGALLRQGGSSLLALVGAVLGGALFWVFVSPLVQARSLLDFALLALTFQIVLVGPIVAVMAYNLVPQRYSFVESKGR